MNKCQCDLTVGFFQITLSGDGNLALVGIGEPYENIVRVTEMLVSDDARLSIYFVRFVGPGMISFRDFAFGFFKRQTLVDMDFTYAPGGTLPTRRLLGLSRPAQLFLRFEDDVSPVGNDLADNGILDVQCPTRQRCEYNIRDIIGLAETTIFINFPALADVNFTFRTDLNSFITFNRADLRTNCCSSSRREVHFDGNVEWIAPVRR